MKFSGQVRYLFLVLFIYTILTLLLFYPLPLYFSTKFIGDGVDQFQNIWNWWWLKTALLELHTNPYYTTHIHHPNGITLLFQSFNPFNGLLTLPLQYLFPWQVTYNLIIVISFVLSGLGMYLLVLYLVESKAAAFVAGLIFTFSPYHFAHALGHTQLVAMEWIPMYILYLFRTFQEGGRKSAVLAGIFLFLVGLCDWYYFYYCLLFTTLFLLYQLIIQRKKVLNKAYIQNLFLTFSLGSILLSPIVVPMVYTKLTHEILGGHEPEIFSADLLSFFIPSGISLYGKHFRFFIDIWSRFSGNIAENSNYIAYTVWVLVIYGLTKVKESRFWGISALTFFLLTLGPYLKVLGHQALNIPLPYSFLHNWLPFFAFTGVPERFAVMLTLSLAIVSGYAVKVICSRTTSSRVKRCFILITSGFIVVEYLPVPYSMIEPKIPYFYQKMATDKDDYAIIDGYASPPLALYLQTLHRKRLIGGYVSRPSKEALDFLQKTPIISHILVGKEMTPEEAASLPSRARTILSQLDIRYIITPVDRQNNLLDKEFRLSVVYESEGLRVYELPAK